MRRQKILGFLDGLERFSKADCVHAEKVPNGLKWPKNGFRKAKMADLRRRSCILGGLWCKIEN